MAETKLSMKLLVDKNAKRVLFAEASKEVIDFLFGLLSLPMSSVIRLLSTNKMVGCVGNLYESVQKFNESYVVSTQNKDLLLNPKSTFPVANLPLVSKEAVTDQNYYWCDTCSQICVTDEDGVLCPYCNEYLKSVEVKFIDSDTNIKNSPIREGFVKGVVTYMVMDDLAVTPMSTISGITLLNKFNIDNLTALEEKLVDFGMEEGLDC